MLRPIPAPSSTEAEELLRATSLFGSLDQELRLRIASELEWLALDAGDDLFEQGSPGDALFVLMYGRLSVLRVTEDRSESIVGEVLPGESVGEMSILTDEVRSATVRARRNSGLVRLSQARFRELVTGYPATLFALSRLLVERLRKTVPQRGPARKIIALVPVNAQSPSRRLADALAPVLSAGERALLVDRSSVDEALGSADPARRHFRMGAWLDQQEREHATIVLVGEAQDEVWTLLCARQADRVVLVARGDDGPGAVRATKALVERIGVRAGQQIELVLVHSDGVVQPSGAARWLDALALYGHHHVRLGVSADVARLARFLTGRAVGLALGGGAMRGMAHLGVLRALEEARVPVDFVAGTSMGALVAAAHAYGFDAAAATRETRRCVTGWGVYDFTLPIVSLFSGRETDKRLQETYGDIHMEDLWRRCVAMSSNLTRAEAVRHERGPLWRGIRASLALPGMFPPVVEGEDILVDGVLLDNLPVDVLSPEICGWRIAVNVINTVDLTMSRRSQERGGRLKLLFNRLNPGQDRPAPIISDILLRAIFLPSVREAGRIRNEVDLYIEPELTRFMFPDTRPFDAIVEVGYQAGRTAVGEWLAHDPRVPRV